MPLVLVLVGSSIPLSISHIALVEETLENQKIVRMGAPMWIEQHKAAQMVIANKPNPDQIRELRGRLNQYRVDIFFVPADNRRKKLLMADMDSTIVTSETLDDIAAKAGLGEQVKPITERAMRGELDFEAALRERVSLLAGQPETLLHDVLAETELSLGAEALTATMRHMDAHCVLVSGGFTFFTSVIAARAGFDHHHGNTLEIEDGKLSGKVIPPVLGKDAKLDFLREYRKRYELEPDDVIAVGDGANDLPMLLEAGLGVGYKPKPLLLEAFDNCIIYGDLSALLYIQGYKMAPQ